jgi:hypothetical protein
LLGRPSMSNVSAADVKSETGDQHADSLVRRLRILFTYSQVPLDVIRQRMGEDGAKMYEWFDRVGFSVDRAALRRELPDVAFHDFEPWAKAQDWNTLLQSAWNVRSSDAFS